MSHSGRGGGWANLSGNRGGSWGGLNQKKRTDQQTVKKDKEEKDDENNNNNSGNEKTTQTSSSIPRFQYKKAEDRISLRNPNFDIKRDGILLQDGLVLLKGFLSLQQQKSIKETCIKLGSNKKGGFYRPHVAKDSEAKMNLEMMCLGYHWNPIERRYEETRSDYDGEPVFDIPPDFKKFCQIALEDSKKVYPDMPPMDANVVLVNLYTETGSLGWHKDKSETQSSLELGTPVISFSIGDSAEFSYLDFDKKERIVILESGDVLLFGGPSRLITHKVGKIVPSSVSYKMNAHDTGLERLNLTFREWNRFS